MNSHSTPRDQEHIQTTVLRFVHERTNGTTCPSEVARVLATESGTAQAWRDHMAAVHLVVDKLKAQGKISLSWKSVSMSKRSGPYRIGKPRR